MFFILNTTKQMLCISDLGITLGPKQATNLDDRLDRSKADSSKDLKALIKKGIIKVKLKDGAKPTKHTVVVEKNNDLNDLKKDINNQIKDGLKDIKDTVNNISKPQAYDNSELLDTIKNLITQMSNNNNVRMNNVEEDEENEINDDILADIHSRAVNKIIKNTNVADISYQKETKENDLEQNIRELENLIN